MSKLRAYRPGDGIIGISVAREFRLRFPDPTVSILEKEVACGRHASGRNSGVLHAGFYYSADSLKARFTREGVHFTITVDGHPKIGPTAIPAFWREQYHGFENFSLRDFAEVVRLQLGLHVLNAVSPGWTCSIPFARHVGAEIARHMGGQPNTASAQSSTLP